MIFFLNKSYELDKSVSGLNIINIGNAFSGDELLSDKDFGYALLNESIGNWTGIFSVFDFLARNYNIPDSELISIINFPLAVDESIKFGADINSLTQYILETNNFISKDKTPVVFLGESIKVNNIFFESIGVQSGKSILGFLNISKKDLLPVIFAIKNIVGRYCFEAITNKELMNIFYESYLSDLFYKKIVDTTGIKIVKQ